MPVEGVLPPGYENTITKNDPTTPANKTVLDKDAFLKLLVAQLKYQNPLSPADPTQFMGQTAQFTMVEELQNMAKDQKASALSQQLTTASSMVGKQITWLDTAGTSQTGVVGSAKIVDGSTVLMVDKVEVPLEAVQAIAAAPVSDPEETVADTNAADQTAADQNSETQESDGSTTS